MEKNPTLSIITICYNIKDDIKRTCDSIVNQTWQDFEWIVVDGGSTDGTVEILKKYQNRINILISEPDKGIYNAMNKGIKLAHGEWLNFMNGGDSYTTNDVLQNVFKGKSYDADILYGYVCMCHPNGNNKICKYPSQISKLYFYNRIINHQASFIKRSLFTKYGLYNEAYRIVSDWEKWIVFADNHCRFEPLKIVVADFWYGGIGSVKSVLHLTERDIVKSNYFKKKTELRIFGFIPLLSIEDK